MQVQVLYTLKPKPLMGTELGGFLELSFSLRVCGFKDFPLRNSRPWYARGNIQGPSFWTLTAQAFPNPGLSELLLVASNMINTS